jgi:hypothetical protein
MVGRFLFKTYLELRVNQLKCPRFQFGPCKRTDGLLLNVNLEPATFLQATPRYFLSDFSLRMRDRNYLLCLEVDATLIDIAQTWGRLLVLIAKQ